MADLALVAVMAIWGSTFAILRFFLSGTGDEQAQASPLLLLAARMGLSSALLLAVLLARPTGRAQLRELLTPGALTRPGSLLRDGLIVGGLLALGFLLQSEGLARTSASRSGFLTGLLVVFVPALELVLFRRRPAPLTLLGLSLAFVGMATLSGPFESGASSTLLGDLLTIACALVFAGHIVALGRVTGRHPILPLLWLQLTSVAVAAAAAGPLIDTARLPPDPRLWAAVIYLALFATLLAFGVQTWAQRRVTPVRLAILQALEPLFAALWAALLLSERLTTRELLGASCILGGVIVGELGSAWASRNLAGGKGAG